MDTARLIQHGTNQAVELPDEYHFEGDRVYIKRLGNAVVLIPEKNPWQPLRDSLGMFSEDFLADRNQPDVQHPERLFE